MAVADKVGVARTTYAMYEQNRRQPDYETLKKLANFFCVSTGYLLDLRNKYEDHVDIKTLLEHGKITYDGVELTKVQRQSCIAFMESILKLEEKKQ